MASSHYREGTVSVTVGSKVVTGVSTKWTQGINKPLAGDMFYIGFQQYEIVRIASDTELHLFSNFAGTSAQNAKYAIIRNASLNVSSRIAAAVSMAINQKQKMVTELNVWMTDTVGPTVPLTDVFGVVKQYVPLPLLVKQINDLVADASNISAVVSEGKQARDQAVQANSDVQQAKTHIDQTKGQIDTIKVQIDQQAQTINTQHGEVSTWHTSAQQSAATATSEAAKAAADALKTADDRSHIDIVKQAIDQAKASVDTSESHINTTKGQIDTINTGLTAKYNEVLSHSSQVTSDKNAVATLKSETETARDEAVDAKNVAQAIASPFIRGVDFTPSAAKEYPTMPSSGTVIMFRVVGVPIGTPYHFTTGDLKGKYVDDDDYLVAMRFSANVVAWSIMKLGRTSIASVNGHSERDITLDKTDIGLGNVNNFGATASVSDESIQKYALAKGVHDAYQHADAALSAANQKWTFDQSAIDNRVTTVGAQNFAGKNGSTTEQFSVPKDPSSDNSATSKAYVDGSRRPNDNQFINADFSVAQAPTSDGFMADCWRVFTNGEANSLFAVTRRPPSTGDAYVTPSNVGFSMREVGSTDAGSSYIFVHQRLELPFKYSGRTVTVSGFIHTRDISYNDVARTLKLRSRYSDSSGTNISIIDTFTTTGTDEALFYSFTFVAPTMNTAKAHEENAYFALDILNEEDYAVNDRLILGNMKLEFGDAATECIPDQPQVNLAKCQRQYVELGDGSSWVARGSMVSPDAGAATIRNVIVNLPVPMRRVPTTTWVLGEYARDHTKFGGKEVCSITYYTTSASSWGGYRKFIANARL